MDSTLSVAVLVHAMLLFCFILGARFCYSPKKKVGTYLLVLWSLGALVVIIDLLLGSKDINGALSRLYSPFAFFMGSTCLLCILYGVIIIIAWFLKLIKNDPERKSFADFFNGTAILLWCSVGLCFSIRNGFVDIASKEQDAFWDSYMWNHGPCYVPGKIMGGLSVGMLLFAAMAICCHFSAFLISGFISKQEKIYPLYSYPSKKK